LVANLPSTASDGIDVTYKYQFGGMTHATTLLFQTTNQKLAGMGDGGQNFYDVKKQYGISHVAETGDLKVHIASMRQNYNTQIGMLFENDHFKYYAVGFNYDPGKWFATADYMKIDDRTFGKGTAYTAGAGVRLGSFTPYTTYSYLSQDSIGQIGAGTVGDDQWNAAVGVRWDFRDNMDLKLQFEHIRTGPMALLFPSALTNVQPGFLNSPKVNAVTVTLDFIF
jgi:predicted porin